MKIAHDVFSETNPAFCAHALVAFTTAYISESVDGPEVPTAYLALPVALSGELAGSFVGTNKNTGLLEWLDLLRPGFCCICSRDTTSSLKINSPLS